MATVDPEEVGDGPEVVEFFSRNFLLMFTALNRLGWEGAAEVPWPSWTSDGRAGFEEGLLSAAAVGVLASETSEASITTLVVAPSSAPNPSPPRPEISSTGPCPSLPDCCGDTVGILSVLAIDASDDACLCFCLPVNKLEKPD